MKNFILIIIMILSFQVFVKAQWSEQSSGVTTPLLSVSMVDNDNVWACGVNGKVLRTTDGGAHWLTVPGNGLPSYLNYNVIAAINKDVAGVAGTDPLMGNFYITTDGGSNWFRLFQQLHGSFNNITVFNTDPMTIGIIGNPVGSRWSIFSSQSMLQWDSTGRYIPQSGSEKGFNNSIWTANTGTISSVWFGTDNGRIYFSSDGGFKWSSQLTPGLTNSRAICLSSDGTGQYYGFAGGEALVKTTNNGSAWLTVAAPGSGNIMSITNSKNNPHQFWFTRGSSIYKTMNDGTDWILDYTASSGTFNHMTFTRDSLSSTIYAVRSDGGISKYTLETPVELTSFTADVYKNNAKLTWSTATETNNEGFAVERSENPLSGNWNAVGFIKGHGTSLVKQVYSFNDNDLLEGKHYYRLRQLDFNGRSELSKEVLVEIMPLGKFDLLQNYPNPFNPVTNIEFTVGSKGLITLKVYDVLGKETSILVDEIKEAGRYVVKFDGTNLPSGMYFYKYQAGNYSAVKKLLLIK